MHSGKWSWNEISFQCIFCELLQINLSCDALYVLRNFHLRHKFLMSIIDSKTGTERRKEETRKNNEKMPKHTHTQKEQK